MIKIIDTLNEDEVYFEGELDELQDIYFENIEVTEEENDPFDLIVSDVLREEMNFYKKAVGYIENEELEELCKSIDEFYENIRFFPKLIERGYLPLSAQSIFLLNP